MRRKPPPRPRNPVARALKTPQYRRRVVQDKRRKPPRTPRRHETDAGFSFGRLPVAGRGGRLAA